MSLKFLAGSLPLLVLSVSAWQFSKSPVAGPQPTPPTVDETTAVPALETVVTEAYELFDSGKTFVLPAGPRGLEYSTGARGLDGKNVRISGFMVRHLHDDPAVFLLTEQPTVLNVAEYGLADSLPPNAVHVFLPVLPGMAPDWVRQPIVVYGRLELGTREEADGRISQVRLYADHITAADGRTLIEPRRSVVLQPARVRSGKLTTPILSPNKPQ